jgi:hypothetical protein
MDDKQPAKIWIEPTRRNMKEVLLGAPQLIEYGSDGKIRKDFWEISDEDEKGRTCLAICFMTTSGNFMKWKDWCRWGNIHMCEREFVKDLHEMEGLV